MPDRLPRVLFLCIGDACRSQMTLGFAAARWRGIFEVASAAIDPQPRVDPRAVLAMGEVGIDITGHRPESLADIDTTRFDFVVTVCEEAHRACPVFRGPARIVHHGFDNPRRLARGARGEDDAMVHYRRVRNEIRDFVDRLPAELGLVEQIAAE